MKLTALEWFEYLPEKQRDRAQAYHLDNNAHSPELLRTKYSSLPEAMINSFTFSETEEGHKHWWAVYEKYQPSF